MKTNDQKPVPMILRLPQNYREDLVRWNGGSPKYAGPCSGSFLDVEFVGEVTSNADQRGAVWGCTVVIAGPFGLTMRKFGRTGGIRAALYAFNDLVRIAVWQVRHDRGLEDDLPSSPKTGAGSFSRPTMSHRGKNYTKRSA